MPNLKIRLPVCFSKKLFQKSFWAFFSSEQSVKKFCFQCLNILDEFVWVRKPSLFSMHISIYLELKKILIEMAIWPWTILKVAFNKWCDSPTVCVLVPFRSLGKTWLFSEAAFEPSYLQKISLPPPFLSSPSLPRHTHT